ncbi:MAG: hypothetical protein ISS93_01095 [Candidatus Aenigmarchaeota archaeon]|nr:hypothetical protein [Candidatus Aenigmarchaeota archaeon]
MPRIWVRILSEKRVGKDVVQTPVESVKVVLIAPNVWTSQPVETDATGHAEFNCASHEMWHGVGFEVIVNDETYRDNFTWEDDKTFPVFVREKVKQT